MPMTFNEFVQIELPKRPFSETDGAPGQVLVRSEHSERRRELVWADMPEAEPPISLVAGPDGVSGHRALMVDQSGRAVHADPAEATAYIGISKHAAAADAAVQVAVRDVMTEQMWSWAPGLPVYYTVGGVLTQTVPNTVALTRIGLAISATTLLIQRDIPIFLGA